MTKKNLDRMFFPATRLLRKKWYENILLLSLFWSWNYWLEIQWQSDYDMIAVVIPTLNQLIRREAVSEEIEFPNNLWHIDVKDAYTFFQKITSLNYLETILTNNKVIDYEVFKIKEFIRTEVIPNQTEAIKAKIISSFNAYKKQVQFEKDEGKKNKMLSHIFRLYILYKEFEKTWRLDFELKWENKEKALKIKLGKEQLNTDNLVLPSTKDLDFSKDNKEVLKELEEKVVSMLIKKIKLDFQ